MYVKVMVSPWELPRIVSKIFHERSRVKSIVFFFFREGATGFALADI